MSENNNDNGARAEQERKKVNIYKAIDLPIEKIVDGVKSYPKYIEKLNIDKGVAINDSVFSLFIEFLNDICDYVAKRTDECGEDVLSKFLNEGFGVFPEWCNPDTISKMTMKYHLIAFKLKYVDPTELSLYIVRDVMTIPVASHILTQMMISKTIIELYFYVSDLYNKSCQKSNVIIEA